MWTITGTANGRRTEVRVQEIEDFRSREQLFSKDGPLLRAGSEGPESLARELSSDEPLPGIDSMSDWGPRAIELIGPPRDGFGLERTYIGATERGQPITGLTWHFEDEPRATAFHAPEAIVADVSGLNEIEITGPRILAGRLNEQFPLQRQYLQWRAYLGEHSAVAEGESEYEDFRENGKSVARARIPLLGSTARLIGRILHWEGRRIQTDHDPVFPSRLRHFEEKHPDIRDAYPNIGNLPDRTLASFTAKPGPTLIFIHGTYSCCIPALSLLHPLSIQTFRFEHDTFLPIRENATRLVEAVKKMPHASPLYFAAHSRGGLVARSAATLLANSGIAVSVRTYGTPHNGTPLANIGRKALNGLLAAGRMVVKGIFPWDAASLAGSLLLKRPSWPARFPEGLDIMRTDNPTLQAMNDPKDPFELRSYGGHYDLSSTAQGACGYFLGEVLYETFARKQHDLVVPTESALGRGLAQQRIEGCDHFHYFSTDAVRTELQQLDRIPIMKPLHVSSSR